MSHPFGLYIQATNRLSGFQKVEQKKTEKKMPKMLPEKSPKKILQNFYRRPKNPYILGTNEKKKYIFILLYIGNKIYFVQKIMLRSLLFNDSAVLF